ncbi:MAG TPA: hypothetical protein VE986_10715 [Hyphomicrobiales bacterium]|nr:hypothetical protein [Hyphomicrobiales bacterium]
MIAPTKIATKLLAVTASFAVLSATAFTSPANAVKPYHRYHRHYIAKPYYNTLRPVAGGDYADRSGWRYRPGIGWDNTCFNLDYLPSQYACSPSTRR